MMIHPVKGTMYRRAAFDIGSGSTKIQCSDCEVVSDLECTHSVRYRIVHTLYGIEKPVQFGADLMRSAHGALSEDITDSGFKVFCELKQEADRLGATQFSAIATEVFRRAANGQAYLDRIRSLGVSVSILSQELEAELGYQSVQCELRENETAEAADCVWDSGGNTRREYLLY